MPISKFAASSYVFIPLLNACEGIQTFSLLWKPNKLSLQTDLFLQTNSLRKALLAADAQWTSRYPNPYQKVEGQNLSNSIFQHSPLNIQKPLCSSDWSVWSALTTSPLHPHSQGNIERLPRS